MLMLYTVLAIRIVVRQQAQNRIGSVRCGAAIPSEKQHNILADRKPMGLHGKSS